MNDFDYDAMQKKNIARSAYHKKGRKRGCTMPSDYMTDAQKKKMNGECITFNIHEPHTWVEFKSASRQIKVEYINWLAREYNTTLQMLGDMFGVSHVTVYKYLKNQKIRINKNAGKTKEELSKMAESFYKFIGKDNEESEKGNSADLLEHFKIKQEGTAEETAKPSPRECAEKIDAALGLVKHSYEMLVQDYGDEFNELYDKFGAEYSAIKIFNIAKRIKEYSSLANDCVFHREMMRNLLDVAVYSTLTAFRLLEVHDE